MSDPYTKALIKKRELEKELHQVNAFLSLYKHFSGSERERVENKILENDSLKRDPKLRPSDIVRLADQFIRERGQPLNRNELVALIESRGTEIDSMDKPRYVGTILWRHKDKFVNFSEFGYWVADLPYEPIGYEPHTLKGTFMQAASNYRLDLENKPDS